LEIEVVQIAYQDGLRRMISEFVGKSCDLALMLLPSTRLSLHVSPEVIVLVPTDPSLTEK
jgi:hypothetical protein